MAAAKAAGLSSGEVDRIVDYSARHPGAGDAIPGTGAQAAVRRPRQRWLPGDHVSTAGQIIPVFLLTVFAKGERSDLTKAERNAVAQLTKALIDGYRTGVGRL